jgi:UDP-N-acetylmuramyl tripeptide synthase
MSSYDTQGREQPLSEQQLIAAHNLGNFLAAYGLYVVSLKRNILCIA